MIAVVIDKLGLW